MAEGEKSIAGNKRAFRDYLITEKIEAGLSLVGTEVKSLRGGNASIQEGWISIDNGQAWLVDAHIPPYTHGSCNNHEPFRKRRLLLHRKEIERLEVRVNERGFTVVPLRLYFKNGKAKLLIGLGKGRHTYDKREVMRKKQDEKDTARALRQKF
jgi:SsrA-binding protein